VIGVIEYGMGNIQSVVNALEFLSVKCTVIHEASEIEKAEKIILPGVGAFGEGIEKLRQKSYVEALQKAVIEKKKPFLGICLGMQLICKESFEFGHFLGLNWIDACVKRLQVPKHYRIPHVGWNNVRIKKKNRLLAQENNTGDSDVYFVHSYYVDALDADFTIATCEYGCEFPAAIEQDNIFAVQFHPEKSQRAGLAILSNFARV